MGCGCNKNRPKHAMPAKANRIVSQQSVSSNSPTPATPQVSAQSVNPNQPTSSPQLSASGLDAQKKAIARARREALRRALNR